MISRHASPIVLLPILALLLLACQGGPVSGATSAPETPGPTVAPPTPDLPDASPAGPTDSPTDSPPPPSFAIATPTPVPTPTPTQKPTATPATDPIIISFSVPPTVSCGAGGSEIQLSWKVERATGVDLAVDGDGTGNYNDEPYPTTHAIDINFPCDGLEHTYVIKALGENGKTVTMKKVVKPAP